jgi:hypothetical protein
VEQPQPDPVAFGHLHQVQFGAVQRPVGGQVAAVLVGVRIAEHDLLPVAAGGHDAPVQRQFQGCVHDRGAGLQVLDGLEQRHDADRRVNRLARPLPRRTTLLVGPGVNRRVGGVEQARLLEQQRRLQ